jgi:hypothetical protein
LTEETRAVKGHDRAEGAFRCADLGVRPQIGDLALGGDTYVSPCTDCADLASGSGRAPRDGYFVSTDEALLQSSYRNNGFYPANRFFSYGFRCARSP